MWRRFLIIFSVIVFLTVGFSARAYSSPGKPAGFVNDFAGILDSGQAINLETKLTEFNKTTSNEISVVTIKSLDGDTIENYANKLFTEWGIGTEKNDNGVLLLIALTDREMRIEPGYGLEGALPDITCWQIITKTMRPAFQAGNYYEGIDGAVNDIISATKGEYTAETTTGSDSFGNLNISLIFFLIFFGFSLLNALWRRLAKNQSWWEGGIFGLIIGLIIAAIFLRSLLYFIIIPLGGALFGLGSDYLVSRVLPKPKPPRRGGGGGIWFGGFGGGGSGSSGGGFGGFGGGGSGGGGSSGSW